MLCCVVLTCTTRPDLVRQMPQHVTAFDEIEKQFCSEFDYTLEAQNLDTVRRLIMPRWGHVVAIPKPHLRLSSKHLLVMEYLHGVKLVDGIKSNFAAMARLQGKSLAELEAGQKQARMT